MRLDAEPIGRARGLGLTTLETRRPLSAFDVVWFTLHSALTYTNVLTNLDLRASQGLGRWWPGAQPRLRLFINNLLNNADQFPSGYSYQFINRAGNGADTLDGIPFYYPLATINLVVMLELGF